MGGEGCHGSALSGQLAERRTCKLHVTVVIYTNTGLVTTEFALLPSLLLLYARIAPPFQRGRSLPPATSYKA